VKVKGVIRTAAAVVLSICVLYGSARADGFPEKFKGGSLTLVSWMKIGFSRIRERFLFGILLNRSSKSFLMLCDLAEVYIAETQNLVYEEFVKNSKLRKDSESRENFEVRDIERTETKTASVKEGLYIDRTRALHLVYDEIKGDGVLDFTLDTSGFREYADSFIRLLAVQPAGARKTSRRQPVTLLLYDRLTSMSSSLTGGEAPETAVFRKSKGAGLRVRFGPHNLVLTRPADLGTADLVFIGLFPYRIGREAVSTFGLIAIVILTILLLWLTVAYTTGWMRLREVPVMGDNKKNQDIIDEIDQELTGERGKKEPETVRTPAGEESAAFKESPVFKENEEKPAKKLEEDGIFIEK
jgi:hypothetical protein